MLRDFEDWIASDPEEEKELCRQICSSGASAELLMRLMRGCFIAGYIYSALEGVDGGAA